MNTPALAGLRDWSNSPKLGSGGGWGGAASLILLAMAALGCAPKQMIPLDIGPEPLVVYLDGERLTEIPEELELKANRDHTFFVKRDGYRPKLVILTTHEFEGRHTLAPDAISLTLKPITDTTKALTIELEEEP